MNPGTVDLLRWVRALVVGGIGLGALVGGIGGRSAMLILRVTSPEAVVGLISDDGFEIGRVTPGGTYALVTLAAGLGLIGAVAYTLVAPWLLGPAWFRGLTSAVGAGAVVGAIIVHPGGVDFTLLEPTWLAIGLFVALPAAFGALIGPVMQWAGRREAIEGPLVRSWALPVLVLAAFPIVTVLLVPAVLAGLVWVTARTWPGIDALSRNRLVGVAVRAGWLVVALLGVVALVDDIDQIV